MVDDAVKLEKLFQDLPLTLILTSKIEFCVFYLCPTTSVEIHYKCFSAGKNRPWRDIRETKREFDNERSILYDKEEMGAPAKITNNKKPAMKKKTNKRKNTGKKTPQDDV